MDIIKVSTKCQIVIPDDVRKRHNIKTDTKLVLLERDNTPVLKKEDEIGAYLADLDEKKEKLNMMFLW